MRNGRSWAAPAPVTLVDPTLKKLVLLFRVLGWAWMLMLVVFGLSAGPNSPAYIENVSAAYSALAVATVWTAVTVLVARTDRRFRSAGFVFADFLVALLVGAASSLAGTEELFHGGIPMSSVLVMAYGGGLGWSLPASIVLGLEQWWVRIDVGRTSSAAAFAIVFPVLALVVGWGFDLIREQSSKRTEAEKKLAAAEAEKARLEERADLANRLHDSVLQTLQAIKLSARQPDQVVYLARHQERELRRLIEQYLSPHDKSFKVALLVARDEVEDLHQIAVDAVVKDDLPLDERLSFVVDSAREAMLNAARHSGAPAVDVFSEVADDEVVVTIRDRGKGFDLEAARGAGHGMANSLIGRMEQVGGYVDIVTAPGEGTDVTIRLELSQPPGPRPR